MIDKGSEPQAFYVSQITLERVRRAAEYAGHATAMVANLHTSGRTERAAAWLAEADAWQERQEELVDQAPLGGRRLTAYASEVKCSAFTASYVSGKNDK